MPPQQPIQTREQFIESLFVLEKKDNLHSEAETKKGIINGINKVVDVVKLSYGSSGSNVIIESELYPNHRAVNDGKAIVEAIKLADPLEQMGRNIVLEVADKSDKESGDGRKTTMILLQAILKFGSKCKEDPMTLKRSLDECLPIILKSIDEQTKQIGVSEVEKVASVASESESLGRIFGEIYTKIGKEGIVEIDNSGTPDTNYEITEGVRLLNCGYQYPYMANEDKGRKAVYKFPKILITKEKIGNVGVLDKILRAAFEKGLSELVIFCDEIDPMVSQSLALLHMGQSMNGQAATPFKTLVIKAPTLWKDWIYEDFAKITGATIVDPTQGHTLKNFQWNWLGYCDKIIVSKTETVVLGIQDIKEHLKVLADLHSNEGDTRIARLQTKTAILKLGANSEVELSYIRGKALDARNSSYLALNHGVVKGAGIALFDSVYYLDMKSVGGTILYTALQSPLAQIRNNTGMSNTDDFHEKFKDIQDAAIVVKNAVTNALSVASMILTTKVAITIPKK